jgi:hypothetical protein
MPNPPLLFLLVAVLCYLIGRMGEYLISLKKDMYKVLLRAGNLTREKWAGNEVKVGDLVKDEDGRVFRVVEVQKTPAAALHTSRLEVL